MAKRITTSEILTRIRNGKQFADVDTILESTGGAPGIGEYLYELMEKYHLSSKDVITTSGIERSYFYHILSGQKSPSRNILLRVAFSISATLTETNNILKYSGQATLYARVRRDALLIMALQKKLSMQEANQVLLSSGEVPLYREESFYEF